MINITLKRRNYYYEKEITEKKAKEIIEIESMLMDGINFKCYPKVPDDLDSIGVVIISSKGKVYFRKAIDMFAFKRIFLDIQQVT